MNKKKTKPAPKYLTEFLLIFLLVIVLLASLFISYLAGFKISLPKIQRNHSSTSEQVFPTPSPIIDNAIKFNVEKAKVGDKIGELTIVKLSGYKSDQATNDSAFVTFSGKISIRGKVLYTAPGGMMGEIICMKDFDSLSQAKMPKLTSQQNVELSFCFADTAIAKKLLVKDQTNEDQGVATVTIENYKIQWFPIEIYNTADLVAAIKN